MQRIQLKVTAADGQKLHYNWGYALYGMLVQRAEPAYIAVLHQRNETPISQYLEVLPGATEAIWHVNLLGEEAIQYFGAVLKRNQTFPAEHHHTELRILEQKWGEPVSEQQFCQTYLTASSASRQHKLELITPVGFKSQEQYQIFPTVELILKSLWRSWQGYSQKLKLEGDDVRDQLIQYTQIQAYQLKSTRYPVKGNRIPAFKGNLMLSVHGPEPLTRLVHMLVAFGEYSGLGMKTALGMGGYHLL